MRELDYKATSDADNNPEINVTEAYNNIIIIIYLPRTHTTHRARRANSIWLKYSTNSRRRKI